MHCSERARARPAVVLVEARRLQPCAPARTHKSNKQINNDDDDADDDAATVLEARKAPEKIK